MSHAENKLHWCIKKAEREGKEHRGIRIVSPDSEKANAHVRKALHNLEVTEYLLKGGYSDWAVSAGFYTMYHCLLAELVMNGYESRNQECTFAAIQVLIDEKKCTITNDTLNKIATFEETTKKETIKLREDFQYGTETMLDTAIIRRVIDEAKELIETVRLDIISAGRHK
jgi:uncharacterized protein (UPF0332 family)